MRRTTLCFVCLAAIGSTCASAQVVDLHYAPAEDLEAIDVAAIDRASQTIDMAAYALTDRPVIAALIRAVRRGVVVRIDRTHAAETEEGSDAYRALATTPGVTIRVKAERALMHLKSYCIDGRLLRTGSANFSPPGLKHQDNDLVMIDDARLAARFEADFASA